MVYNFLAINTTSIIEDQHVNNVALQWHDIHAQFYKCWPAGSRIQRQLPQPLLLWNHPAYYIHVPLSSIFILMTWRFSLSFRTLNYLVFEVVMNSSVFWDTRLVVRRNSTLLATYFTPVACLASFSVLKMEPTCYADSSVHLQCTQWCYNPEDRIIRLDVFLSSVRVLVYIYILQNEGTVMEDDLNRI
jgi:hypothetical protein